jgi:hypothetical protein
MLFAKPRHGARKVAVIKQQNIIEENIKEVLP